MTKTTSTLPGGAGDGLIALARGRHVRADVVAAWRAASSPTL